MTERAPSVYLDSNVFIDFVEGGDSLSEPLKRLFVEGCRRPNALVSSEITLAEVLAPTKALGAVPSHVRRSYLDLIVWGGGVDLHPVSRKILFETVELRKFTRHKLPDAIHCVTAIEAGCTFLMSRDRHMRKLPPGIAHLSSDGVGVATFLEALGA